MKRLYSIFLLFSCFVFFTSNVLATVGSIRFVETTVKLNANGSATVRYLIKWEVLSEMHGFYFAGNDKLKINGFGAESNAVDSEGNRYDLDITKVGSDRWDIVLADGQGVSEGMLTYMYYFNTNFATAGYVDTATSVDGRKLVLFNWSPVQWDEGWSQEHYTLTIITPVNISNIHPEAVRAYVEENQVVLAEPFVNEEYLIEYRKSDSGFLEIVFHKENPGNLYHMQTRFYLPAGWFDLAPENPGKSDKKRYQYFWEASLLLPCCFVVFFLHYMK